MLHRACNFSKKTGLMPIKDLQSGAEQHNTNDNYLKSVISSDLTLFLKAATKA